MMKAGSFNSYFSMANIETQADYGIEESQPPTYMQDCIPIEGLPEGKNLDEYLRDNTSIRAVVVAGPPTGGKSTAIVDLIRLFESKGKGVKLSLFDETMNRCVIDGFPKDKDLWTTLLWRKFSKRFYEDISETYSTLPPDTIHIIETVSVSLNYEKDRARSTLEWLAEDFLQRENRDSVKFLFFAYNPRIVDNAYVLRQSVRDRSSTNGLIEYMEDELDTVIENLDEFVMAQFGTSSQIRSSPTLQGEVVKEQVLKSAEPKRIARYIDDMNANYFAIMSGLKISNRYPPLPDGISGDLEGITEEKNLKNLKRGERDQNALIAQASLNFLYDLRNSLGLSPSEGILLIKRFRRAQTWNAKMWMGSKQS